MDLKYAYMEKNRLNKNGLFSIVFFFIIIISVSSCVLVGLSSEIDLGGGYCYVQDYPQCVCKYPESRRKAMKIVIPPQSEKMVKQNIIVVRVQYNDSIIVATCSSDYCASDSTCYELDKTTGMVNQIEFNNKKMDSKNCKEVKNKRRYAE